MTFPLPINDPPERKRANWLGRYLTVEGQFDKLLKDVLVQATSDVSDAFGDLREDLFSAKVRRVQIAQSGKAIRRIINGLFGTETDLIREHQQDAAMAAVDASLYDQRGILSQIFKPAQLQSYAQSLELTAARNIDAVMTRVLETEKPLSARVYHSRALAQGQVNRAINKVLATGGSAKDLAKEVTSLIDPATPGGVSYAARRLGRTELNNAFHAQSIHDAQAVPWIEQMEWFLSKRHETDPGDECEQYALIQYFSTDHVPEKPHPNCRCYVTPKVPDRESFVQAVDSGQYNDYLDNWLEGGSTETPALPRTDDAFSVSSIKPELENITRNSEHYKTPIKPTVASKVSEAVKKQPLHEIESIPGALAEAKRRHKITISGMEYVDPKGVSQFFEFVDKYQTQYPGVALKKISVKELNVEGAQAVTHMGDPKNITMDFDRSWVSNYKLAQSNGKKDMESGHFAHGTHDRPFYGVLVHEYGHVLHTAAGGRDLIKFAAPDLENDPGYALHNAWQADEKDDSPNLNVYIEKYLSGYSFKRYDPFTKTKQNFNDAEAIAEAFIKVELDPKGANSAQKALHKFLVDKVKDKKK